MNRPLPVQNMTAAAERLHKRLREVTSSLPVQVGWCDGAITAYSGTQPSFKARTPVERIELEVWLSPEEIEARLAVAVARLQVELPPRLAVAPKGKAARVPRKHHPLRRVPASKGRA